MWPSFTCVVVTGECFVLLGKNWSENLLPPSCSVFFTAPVSFWWFWVWKKKCCRIYYWEISVLLTSFVPDVIQSHLPLKSDMNLFVAWVFLVRLCFHPQHPHMLRPSLNTQSDSVHCGLNSLLGSVAASHPDCFPAPRPQHSRGHGGVTLYFFHAMPASSWFWVNIYWPFNKVSLLTFRVSFSCPQ